MLGEADARSLAYQVLDQVLAGRSLPPGTRGAMFLVVDSLRASAARSEDRDRVESISIGIQKLECALQRRDNEAARAARTELKQSAADWLNARIVGSG